MTNPRYLTIHQVHCEGSSPSHSRHPENAHYLDVPRLFRGDSKPSRPRGRLSGHQRIQEARNDPAIGFIIYRKYDCIEYQTNVWDRIQSQRWGVSTTFQARRFSAGLILAGDADPASPGQEHMEISSQHLRDAIRRIQSTESDTEVTLSGWDQESNMLAPYLHFYHTRHVLRTHGAILAEPEKQHVENLLDYLDTQFGTEYQEVDDLFREGYVTIQHFHKLFGPGEVLVTFDDNQPTGVVSNHCPLPGSHPIRLGCEAWKFDGCVIKYKKGLMISFPKVQVPHEKILIQSLPTFPLRLDQSGLEHELRSRGQRLWECRRGRYVSYQGSDQALFSEPLPGPYVVDAETYRILHGGKRGNISAIESDTEHQVVDSFQSTAHPPGNLDMLLPCTVFGFSMEEKAWRKLSIRHIRDVQPEPDVWDKLVINVEVKTALLLHIGAFYARKSLTDRNTLQRGALVIYLSGPPGTATTDVAEAVARSFAKPLYRLNMSENDQNGLDVSMRLCRSWGAVVLVDGAENIFDYHDPKTILQPLASCGEVVLLCSTQMGSLGIRNRYLVHLSLTIPPLNNIDRKLIWGNLIEALSHDVEFEARPDAQEAIWSLRVSLSWLGEHKFTRSEIHNAFGLAKQLAAYQNETLARKHLEDVIQATFNLDPYEGGE